MAGAEKYSFDGSGTPIGSSAVLTQRLKQSPRFGERYPEMSGTLGRVVW